MIATTISGSIKDRDKVDKIIPLFRAHGYDDVTLHVVDSHAEARKKTSDLVSTGSRTIISAGGSGTFNSVLEGCIDTQVGLSEITLGFLRKGSADLIGKTLDMPDIIEDAIEVFVNSLAHNYFVTCDVIKVVGGDEHTAHRHFVGYGGTGIFGRIPHYTENRFIKHYKGVLGQLFGDMGPFFVGASLATLEKVIRYLGHRKIEWRVSVDGRESTKGNYQAMIVVNGDLDRICRLPGRSRLDQETFTYLHSATLGCVDFPANFDTLGTRPFWSNRNAGDLSRIASTTT